MARYKFSEVPLRDIQRGDSFEAVLDIGPQFNLDGFSAFAQVRKRAGDTGLPILTLSCNVNGQILTLSLEPGQTRDIPIGSYVYDVEFRNGLGEVHSMPTALFEIVGDVTRST